MADLDTQVLRRSSEEFSVVLSDMSSLQERIELVQEEIAALANEQTGCSLFAAWELIMAHVYHQATELKNNPKVENGDCVALVRAKLQASAS